MLAVSNYDTEILQDIKKYYKTAKNVYCDELIPKSNIKKLRGKFTRNRK